MTPEQKKRAQSEIAAMHNAKNSYLLTHMAAACMADLLQELIAAEQAAGVHDGWQNELLDWVTACQSAYHIDSTPGHRFGGLGSNLEENRASLIEYVEGLIAAAPQAPAVQPVATIDTRDGDLRCLHWNIPLQSLAHGTQLYTLPSGQPDTVNADDLAKLLPYGYYMDPPDGGSPTVLEQVARMAKDAERYRYLRNDGAGFDIAVAELDDDGRESWVHGYPPDELDAAIDAAIKAQNGGE